MKKKEFYSCKEIIIRSGYCKLLLNQGYVICDKCKFLCCRFTISNRFLNLKIPKIFAVSPMYMTLLVKIMLTIVENSFFILINVRACL